MLAALCSSNPDSAAGLRSPSRVKVSLVNSPKRFRALLAAFALGTAVIFGACGEEDAVNEAQDEIQRQAEDFTQGIPEEAQDVQQQAEDAAQDVQDQIDDLTNDGGSAP